MARRPGRLLADDTIRRVLVYRKGVFCLESEWYGLRSSISVRPGLEMLKASDYAVRFIHRDVATRDELEHYLRKWQQGRQDGYDILWLAMHSRRGILLPGDMRRPSEKLRLADLQTVLAGKCAGRLIHFGGCHTILLPKARIAEFLKVTRAVGISGFCEEVDWTESTLFEMSYLVELQKHPLTRAGLTKVRNSMRRMRPVEFRDSGFAIHLR